MVLKLARLRRRLSPRLALHHNIKINQLLRERPDVVREAERVLPNAVRRQHVVPLPLLRAIEQVLVLWIFDLEGDIEGPAGLNGKVELSSYMRELERREL